MRNKTCWIKLAVSLAAIVSEIFSESRVTSGMPDEDGSAAVVAIPDSFGDGRRGGVSNGSATNGTIVAGDGGRADGVSSTGIER